MKMTEKAFVLLNAFNQFTFIGLDAGLMLHELQSHCSWTMKIWL